MLLRARAQAVHALTRRHPLPVPTGAATVRAFRQRAGKLTTEKTIGNKDLSVLTIRRPLIYVILTVHLPRCTATGTILRRKFILVPMAALTAHVKAMLILAQVRLLITAVKSIIILEAGHTGLSIT